MPAFKFLSALLLVAVSSSEAFTTTTIARPVTSLAAAANDDNSVDHSRRGIFQNAGAFAAMVAFTPVVAANALDMDAFANAQVSAREIKFCNP